MVVGEKRGTSCTTMSTAQAKSTGPELEELAAIQRELANRKKGLRGEEETCRAYEAERNALRKYVLPAMAEDHGKENVHSRVECQDLEIYGDFTGRRYFFDVEQGEVFGFLGQTEQARQPL